MAWKGETEHVCHSISHKAICPLLRRYRLVAKGTVTAGSSGLVEAMEEYLRAAVSEVPGEDIQGSRSAVAA